MTTGPSEEFVRKHRLLSSEFLDDVVANLDQGRLRTAVDRAYYSIHNAAFALLSHLGIRPPRSHRGLVTLFGQEVINKGLIERDFGRMLTTSLRNRMDSTYSIDAEITYESAESAVSDARRFFTRVGSILDHGMRS